MPLPLCRSGRGCRTAQSTHAPSIIQVCLRGALPILPHSQLWTYQWSKQDDELQHQYCRVENHGYCRSVHQRIFVWCEKGCRMNADEDMDPLKNVQSTFTYYYYNYCFQSLCWSYAPGLFYSKVLMVLNYDVCITTIIELRDRFMGGLSTLSINGQTKKKRQKQDKKARSCEVGSGAEVGWNAVISDVFAWLMILYSCNERGTYVTLNKSLGSS